MYSKERNDHPFNLNTGREGRKTIRHENTLRIKALYHIIKDIRRKSALMTATVTIGMKAFAL